MPLFAGEVLDAAGLQAPWRVQNAVAAAVSNWASADDVPPARRLQMWRLARKRGVDWTPPEAAGLTLEEAA